MKSDFYKNKLTDLKTQKSSLEKKYGQTSTIRLILIVVGLILLIQLFQFNLILGSVFVILFIGSFYYLVKYHDGIESDKQLVENEISLLENELIVLTQKTNSKYYNGSLYAEKKHIYSADLDIFGETSLFEYINRCKTKQGNDLLAKNLLEIVQDSSVLDDRQETVKELSEKTEWRLEFQASLFNVSESQWEVSEKISELSTPPKLKFEKFIFYYGKALPIIWIVAIGLMLFKGLMVGGNIFGGLFLFNVFLEGQNKKELEPYLRDLSVSGKVLDAFKKAASLIVNNKFDSTLLKTALADFPASSLNSKNPIDDFAVILKKLEIRQNMLASILITLFKPFQAIEIINLSIWLEKNPHFFGRIFGTVGVFEFYSSLATLSFNNPDWCYPELHNNADEYLSFTAAGHPLVRSHEVICNDFVLDKRNHLNLITGSNMSGKSTFLRTMGLNVIIANLGGVVFANKFRMKTGLKPICYMRIADSLQENASTFKTEIDRIKLVLTYMENEKNCLFLIDEMLRGTNSEDKLLGSMALLEKVIKHKAIAFIATHDLRLTEISDKYPEEVKNYYFEYNTENGELKFDYLLKEGVCKSFNASLLLESIGLELKSL